MNISQKPLVAVKVASFVIVFILFSFIGYYYYEADFSDTQNSKSDTGLISDEMSPAESNSQIISDLTAQNASLNHLSNEGLSPKSKQDILARDKGENNTSTYVDVYSTQQSVESKETSSGVRDLTKHPPKQEDRSEQKSSNIIKDKSVFQGNGSERVTSNMINSAQANPKGVSENKENAVDNKENADQTAKEASENKGEKAEIKEAAGKDTVGISENKEDAAKTSLTAGKNESNIIKNRKENIFLSNTEHTRDDLVIGGLIGNGSQAKVYKGTLKSIDGDALLPVAIKIFTVAEYAETELGISRKLNNLPFVSQLYWWTMIDGFPALIFKFMDGCDLSTHLLKADSGSFANESQQLAWIRKVMMRLIVTLKKMHERGILHGDIKPNNIMLHEGDVHYIDFGIACEYSPKVRSRIGTFFFSAPEMYLGRLMGYESDIFSLGITFLYLLTDSVNDVEEARKRVEGARATSSGKNLLCNLIPTFSFKPWLPSSARDLFLGMTHSNPKKRLTIPEIMRHALFDGGDWTLFGETKPSMKPRDGVVKKVYPDVSAKFRMIQDGAENAVAHSSTSNADEFQVESVLSAVENTFAGSLNKTKESVAFKVFKQSERQKFLKNSFLLSIFQAQCFIHKLLRSGMLSDAHASSSFGNMNQKYFLMFPFLPSPLEPGKLLSFDDLSFGTLSDFVDLKWDRLKHEYALVIYFAKLIVALRFFHANGLIVNMDPERVIVTFMGDLLFYDLSAARYYDPVSVPVPEGEVTYYSAPEMLSEGTCGYASDIYTLGIIFYEHVAEGYKTRTQPKEYLKLTDRNAKLKFKMEFGQLRTRDDAPLEMRDLVRRCLEPNPKKRIMVEEIMRHDLFDEIDWDKLIK